VRVYSDEEVAAAQQKPLVSFLLDLSYKRRVFEVALDVILIVLAHYAAYALTFGPARAASGDWQLFLRTIPAIVFIKLGAFLAVGVYRGLWRYASLGDAVLFTKAVALGSAGSLLLLVFAFRFEGCSRTVFALDGILLLMFLTGSRFAFRTFRKVFPVPHARTGTRVLIYGAGDAGELLWRELTNNTEMGYLPVGFVDDDHRKAGKVIHGLPVYPGDVPLGAICERARAKEVFLSTAALPNLKVRAIVGECESAGVAVKRMSIEIERLADAELGWVLPTRNTDIPAPPIVAVDEKLTITGSKERPHLVH
jgi:UDP-GlcNAc:undecaprenyl-phosphate/decaprenyl-phosphate GlcNAc-1-phosphate transferase